MVYLERVLGADHFGAVDVETGQRLHIGAGGQHDVLADDAFARDLNGVRRDELAGAFDVGDLGRLDQALQPLVQAVDDTVLVGVEALHVDADEFGLDAELFGLARLVGDLARVEERLRRDAPAMQARAAELVLLDQSHRQVELRGPQRGRVSAAATTENYDVKLAHEISYDAATAPGE